ncbi:MAG: hypothetical protein JPMHGGIA_00619 [Saprospiraceae bacterium]|jgi:hypothetical protein|nr:hypothetical protein [Saprospiraceae bacterium]
MRLKLLYNGHLPVLLQRLSAKNTAQWLYRMEPTPALLTKCFRQPNKWSKEGITKGRNEAKKIINTLIIN